MTPVSRSISALVCTVAALAAGTASAADLLSLRLEELMEIGVVGASKYEQPQSDVAAAVSVITRQEIRAHGWRTLSDALVSLPGFTASYDRQYHYPTFRGIGLPGDYATRLLVTINGNRLNDPLYDQGTFGRMLPIDLDLVERIEFIPGPGGAVYGQNAMFGVVNLVTRNGVDLDGLELSASGQQPQRLREGRASWGGRVGGDTELLLSASAMDADGENRFYDYGAAGVSGVARGLDYERDREAFARLRHGPGRWTRSMARAPRAIPPRTSSPIRSCRAGAIATSTVRRSSRSRSRSNDDAWQVFARVFVGRYDSDGTGTSLGYPFDATGAARWFGGEAQLVSTAFTAHKLMFGVEGQVETRRDQSFLDLTTLANSLYLSGDGHRTGIYVQDEWRFATGVVGDARPARRQQRQHRHSLQPARGPAVASVADDGAEGALRARASRAQRIRARLFRRLRAHRESRPLR